MYARFGPYVHFDESQCWPNRDSLRETIKYEKFVYPLSLEEMIANGEKARVEKEEKVKIRLVLLIAFKLNMCSLNEYSSL